jgi:uncharacterized membrane protein YbhN (UPF0104 family)/tRNA A-37 threonylcarbamoyl transferase component Bud32
LTDPESRPEENNGVQSAGSAGSTFFVSSTGEPRVRRPIDALVVAAGAALIAITAWRAVRIDELEGEIVDVFEALPSWINEVAWGAYTLAALYAFGLLVAVLVKRRFEVGRDLLVAVLGTVVLELILVRLVEDAWPRFIPELDRAEVVAQFPVFRVAVVAAVIAVAAPHLVRPWRRLGWVVLATVVLSGLVIGLGLPSHVVGAVGLGLAVAGSTLVMFGSPRGYPNVAAVDEALRRLGISAQKLRLAPQQSWGVRLLVAEAPDGTPLAIKAYGRDAADSQLIAKAWRYLWYRDTGASLSFTRIGGVEHEALVILMAGRAGAATSTVLAAAMAGQGDALLVVDQLGVSLAAQDPGSISDAAQVDAWRDVQRLHEASISHGRLTTENVRVDGEAPVIANFEAGSLAAPPERMAKDVAEFLFSLATLVGAERTVRGALEGYGLDGLVEVLPYLQLAAISATTRKQAGDPKLILSTLKQEITAQTGVEIPEPAEVRRVQTRDVLTLALTLLAGYVIITALAGIDWAAVWDEIQEAVWAWFFVAFVVGQLRLIPEATGMMAAVSLPIPMRPTVVVQAAGKFIGLAVPGIAGQVTMNAAYLRKFGMGPTEAVTQGTLDSLSGLLVEVVILALAFLVTDLSWDTESAEGNLLLIVGVVVAAVLLGIVVVLSVKSIRDRVVPVVREAVRAFTLVFREPSRAIALLGSNLGSRLILAAAMWLTLRGFGITIGIGSVLIVTVGANLLAGVVPIPGGAGVAEAVIAIGLVAFGVPETIAFAAAVVYRVLTAYLPPIYGWFAMGWLRDNAYV